MNQYPDTLYHYYEANRGPLVSLSDLSLEDAEGILAQIRRDGLIFASRRSNEYLQIRRELEERIRSLFVDKGGQPRRARPHYFILGRVLGSKAGTSTVARSGFHWQRSTPRS